MMENEGVRDCQTPAYACWINGEAKAGSRSYPLIDPSTGGVHAYATVADKELVDSALVGARDSFNKWRTVPAAERASILHGLADGVRKQQEALTLLVSREVGKPLRAALEEVMSAASLIDYSAEESLRLAGRIPLMGYHREHVLIVREPVGVVVAITPFNYPLSTLACKMAPALAVGCTVVAKPDEHTPLSTLKLAEIASQAGLPAGVFNVLTGPGPDTGRLLVEHPIPRLVTFTGSTDVGKEIQATSAQWARKVILELGGNCPAIVCEDAPWQGFLPQLVSQCLKNAGQYCYRISRIYIGEGIYDDFVREFVKLAGSLRVGPATDPDVELGPLNNPEIVSRVRSQVETAVKEGARAELGGNQLSVCDERFFYPPTVLTGVGPEMAIMQEEVFGPVVIISAFRDIREAIQGANGTPYGLAAYLFTHDLGNALEWAGQLEVGSVWINRIHQAYPEAPFGGMKESGLGREKSSYGLEEFTELKTVYLCY